MTFRSIEKALDLVKEVDLDNDMIHMVMDGFKPLSFETTIEFHNGEEITANLRYERLVGYCYDYTHCLPQGGNGENIDSFLSREHG